MASATACFAAERRGDRVTGTHTALMFSGVLTVRFRPVGFVFKADDVFLKFFTHNKIVFLPGTGACRFKLKGLRNKRCVKITESILKWQE